MNGENQDSESFLTKYCEITDSELPKDHNIFKYLSEMKMSEASLGLAISEGVRLQATREILDMFDTLYQILYDPDSKLPDPQRKRLNHADDVWLDMKEKMNAGDKRAAHLLNAHAHMDLALAYLVNCRNDPVFAEIIPEYLLKYLEKLSVFTYREAIGHVML